MCIQRQTRRSPVVVLLVLVETLVPLLGALAATDEVRPIRWSAFRTEAPRDPDSLRVRSILLNANRYALTTWWTRRGYDRQQGEYLSFGGTNERHIRPPASEAFALAVVLSTGAYAPSATGVSRTEAKARTLKLIRSLARGHLVNRKGGWGDHWQSALWASSAGFAAWLLWEDLPPDDQRAVRRMVQHEANRFRGYPVPYYRDRAGTILFPGDSKAEENTWNSRILQLATVMMPEHPRRELWKQKMTELMLSAFARPTDVQSTRRVEGKPLSAWLQGSNVRDDGLAINHNRIHPDYVTSVTDNIHAALLYTLARMPIPEAAFFNADVVYAALEGRRFTKGTIYRDDSAEIYYPQGTRWGTGRRMHFALFDIQAWIFGLDRRTKNGASHWAALHTRAVFDMQRRAADGRTYQARHEDRYPGREEWVADLAAQAYLTKWLRSQRPSVVSDEPRFPPPTTAAAGEESS